MIALLSAGCSTATGGGSPCEQGLDDCGGACVDMSSEPEHCGACGNACAWGEQCIDGVCGLYCEQSGLLACDGMCVDTSKSQEHCGGCGNACAGAEQCVAGKCTCPANIDVIMCNGVCVDPWSDVNNCGSCGHACSPNAQCFGGECYCQGAQQDCGAGCIDVESDANNCGYCGNSCGPGAQCVNGGCVCAAGTSNCGNGCTDIESDPNNCGYCFNTCGSGQQCVNGTCGCPAGMADCGLGCVDLMSDENSCGVCGLACGPSEQCVGGTCACGPGTLDCGGACTSPKNDPNNCGACGNACASGTVCVAGACVVGNSDWGTFGHDERHSGYNAGEKGKPPLSLAWSASLGGGSVSPAVVEGGRVFATTQYGGQSLYAMSVTSGAVLWEYAFGSVFSVGHPTVAQGKVYVGQCDHTPGTFLWKFEAASGSLAWKAPYSAQWENYWAPIVVGGNVYFNGGYYGGLYGLHDADGSSLFFNGALEQYDLWSPAYFGGQVFSFVAGNLRAHDPTSGATLWATPLNWNWAGWSMGTAPVFGDKFAYAIAPPNLYAVDPTTHAIAWTANGSFQSVPAVAGNTVYGISGGDLQARDATTGGLLWMYGGDGSLSYPPVVANGFVYVSSGSQVHAIDIATHTEVWSAPFGGWLSIGSGRLFVAQSDGTLNAYALTP